MSLDLRSIDLSSVDLRWRSVTPNDHFVEIYDDDESLLDSVRTFITIGISRDEPAIVIAEPSHREALKARLNRSVDLRRACERGLYVSLDAAETLAQFMNDGVPDLVPFENVLGDLLRPVTTAGKTPRVFGEMVALLWREGNVAGALALEDLWNQLSLTYPFRLFCGYPEGAFSEEQRDAVTAICEHHSHVIFPRADSVRG
jgi:hypothetical protein